MRAQAAFLHASSWSQSHTKTAFKFDPEGPISRILCSVRTQSPISVPSLCSRPTMALFHQVNIFLFLEYLFPFWDKYSIFSFTTSVPNVRLRVKVLRNMYAKCGILIPFDRPIYFLAS